MAQTCHDAGKNASDKTHYNSMALVPVKRINLDMKVITVSSALQWAGQMTKFLGQEAFERGRKSVMGW
jgi:hypothetical protein